MRVSAIPIAMGVAMAAIRPTMTQRAMVSIMLAVMLMLPGSLALACSRVAPTERVLPEIEALLVMKGEGKTLSDAQMTQLADFEKDMSLMGELSEKVAPVCTTCPAKVAGNTCEPGYTLCGSDVSPGLYRNECFVYGVTEADYEDSQKRINALRSKWYTGMIVPPAAPNEAK